MRILRFDSFITEKSGVGIASIRYSEAICDRVEKEFGDFLETGSRSERKTVEIKKEELAPFMGSKEEFRKFPLVNVRLELGFERSRLEKEEFSELNHTPTPVAVGGTAYRFGHKNWSGYSRKTDADIEDLGYGLDLLMGIDVMVPKGYDAESEREGLRDGVMEAIYHEMNHMYEYYNRLLNQKGLPLWKRSPSISITHSDYNSWRIPSQVYDFWSGEFTYYLYLSEPHEIRAQSQEAAYSVMKKGFESVYKTAAWKYAKEMEDFDAEKFLSELDAEISSYIDQKGPEKTALYSGMLALPLKERLKQMWLSEYQKITKEYGDKPIFDIEEMKKKPCDAFVRHMGKRINMAGDRLKRNLGRLFDLSDPEHNIYNKTKK